MGSSEHSNRPPFGGHEKFTFRHGWLKKGLDAILEDPLIFSREEAFIVLGVGKNMAASIRYWGLALGLFQATRDNPRVLIPSALGEALLAESGWDPYLEDVGSLWLLHWQLASNQERGLVWHLAFSHYYDVEFRKPTLIEFLKTQLTQRGIETTEGMIEREFDVFIRTYVPAQGRKGDGEETLSCPLVDLNLIRLSSGDGVYRFDVGAKSSLPAARRGPGPIRMPNVSRRRPLTWATCGAPNAATWDFRPLFHQSSAPALWRWPSNWRILCARAERRTKPYAPPYSFCWNG